MQKMLAQNKTSQKLISALLIISILAPVVLFSVARRAAAQVESVSACVAAIAAGAAEGAATGGVGAAGAIGSVPVNSTTANTIAAKIAGITKGTENFKYKECLKEVLRDTLKLVAKRFLAKMTESTVNWINSGFHGKPLFLENPGSFFKDIAKSEIKNMVSLIGYNGASYPFGKSFLINAINSYKSTFAQNAQYSLSKVTNDPALLDSFQNNFSTGGWDGFLLTTQFPQNNYIGSQIMYSDYLSQKLAGTTSAPAEKVKDLLAQGQGFLSPQTCVTNTNYNNLHNQFDQPTFKCSLSSPNFDICDSVSNDPILYQSCISREQKLYNTECATQKATWEKTNSCPAKPDGSSGLVNTTPGSVVANQIMSSMTSGQRQGELSAALGNSLSAIFDALLNQLFQKGLNSLTSTLNGSNNTNDNFDYYGNTLGTAPSTTNGTGFNWNSPEEVIVLSTFKRDVQSAIDNANKELKLIDVDAVTDPGTNDLLRKSGILQVFENIWPKTEELDMCLPGPNLGWQNRIDTEVQKTATDETASAAEAFKLWVTNKMKIELPGSNTYINSVSSINTINAQVSGLTARESVITETLIKLKSIQSELGTITVEPSPGSTGEAALIRLKQRYDSMLTDLSNSTTVADMQNKLADAQDKLANLNTLLTRCGAERATKGWSNPGGQDSTLNNSSTEKVVFCSSYGTVPVGCDIVFKTDIADYKNSSAGTTFPIR